MSDERSPDELLELPLSHKESWETIHKGSEGASPGAAAAPPRRRASPRRRRWPVALGLVAAAVLGYRLFWPSPPRVEFDSQPLAFATQLAGSTSEPQQVVLTNAGERTLRIDTIGVAGAPEADFVTDSEDCSGAELPSGSQCRVGLRFVPRGPGARGGELEVAGNMRGARALLELVGEAVAPRLGARPETLDFGSESVGGTTPGRDLELVNNGSAPLSIDSVSVDSERREFRLIRNECSAERLAPQESCALRLVFSPALLGERAAVLAVASDSVGEADAIRLVGSGSGPDLRPEPPGLAFGDQLVGTRSEVAQLVLANHGDAAFRIHRVWIPAGEAFRIVRQTCSGASLEAGASCSVEIVFEPAREGSAESSLEIQESSGGTAPGVGISGRGVTPRLELSSGSLDFGAVLPGERPGDRSVTLANKGSAPLRIGELRVVGDEAAAFPKGRDDCAGVELGPGGRCEVVVGFAPRRGGAHTARLTIDSSPPGIASAIGLKGHGRAPRLDLDRQRLDFAAVRQSESQDLRVKLSNGGDAPLGIEAVRCGGAAAPDFAVASDSCSRQSLPPGASCQVVVRFTPTANGSRDGRLIIESDAGGGAAPLVLRGVGREPPAAGIEVSPLALEFGSLTVGERSEAMTVTIASVGQGRLRISEMRVEGRDAADFRVVPGTCHGLPHVVPGGDCTAGVRFTPTAQGRRLARLVIVHNAEGGSVEVSLGAEGYQP